MRMPLLAPVVAFVLYLVLCSPSRVLNFLVVSLALQAYDGIHLGVDNLGVVRHVGRLLDGRAASRPVELVKDGDLVLLIERMLHLRGLDTVRISKVKGHADEALVPAEELLIWIGLVTMELMRLPTLVVGGCLGGLLMLGVIILGCVPPGCPRLASVFIAIASAVVNHDGAAGTSLDPTVWSVGGAPKRRRVVHAVRDRAFLPGPAGVRDGEWGVVAAAHITCHDIELWQYSVSMLVKWVCFLYSALASGWSGSWSGWCLLC